VQFPFQGFDPRRLPGILCALPAGFGQFVLMGEFTRPGVRRTRAATGREDRGDREEQDETEDAPSRRAARAVPPDPIAHH
jgi:hypothetical protein